MSSLQEDVSQQTEEIKHNISTIEEAASSARYAQAASSARYAQATSSARYAQAALSARYAQGFASYS